MASNLDSRIQDIVARAAAEITRAVRSNIAEEVQRVVGMQADSRRTARPALAVAATGGAVRARRAGARRGARRTVSETDMKTVLDYIVRTPGKRSEEIRAALDMPREIGRRILAKLRDSRSVKTKGQKRTTTYYPAA